MINRLSALASGLQFRFLLLVAGVAAILLAAQFVVETWVELSDRREARLEEAMSVTNVIARSLEKQFEYIELDDIEKILVSVRSRKGVEQVSVVDAARSFYLDGDLMTSPVMAFDDSPVQQQALSTARTALRFTEDRIEVAEPLMGDASVTGGFAGSAIGSVMIAFHNPGFAETVWPIIQAKIWTVVPILLAGLLIATRMVGQITAPLTGLAQTANQISSGKMDSEARVEGAREIRQLAAAFNQMIGTIRSNIAQIYDLAYVDKTTKLPNREFFRREMTQAIAFAVRESKAGALLFVDMDGFKRINDTFGHDFGDKLLFAFSDRIQALVRKGDRMCHVAGEGEQPEDCEKDGKDGRMSDSLSRLGGDEFTILLPAIREETDAAHVAKRVIASLEQPFSIDGKEIQIGCSIGIATFPRDGVDYQTVLKHADMAMYQAKEEGKHTYRFFSAELNAEARKRMEIETDLRKAISEGGLMLHFQPKVDATTHKPCGLEALLRWQHPEKGMISPGEFIPVAEDTGLILPLGAFVLREACKQIVSLCEAGYRLPVAVNVSVQQFEKQDFARIVEDILSETGADASLLELEITESMAMNNADIAVTHINRLKKAGVRFAVDDFGTGYSNLAQLSRIPFDVFKIDRSFVMGLGEGDRSGEVIVHTIIAMAHSLNYETVAEGVETAAQAEILRKAGCPVLQGFLFARPMPVADLGEWLSVQGAMAKPAKRRRKAA